MPKPKPLKRKNDAAVLESRPKRRCVVENKPRYVFTSNYEEDVDTSMMTLKKEKKEEKKASRVKEALKKSKEKDRKATGKAPTAPTTPEKLSTCFGPENPFDLPQGLSPDVNDWSVNDVITFVDYFISPLEHFCPEPDMAVIRKKRIDGRVLVDLACNEDFTSRLSVRIQLHIVFRVRYLINVMNGY